MQKKKWTPEAIKAHITARNEDEPLNSHYYAKKYPSIYAAAERIFGSWGNAIEAAGIDYISVRKYNVWTRQRILLIIREKFEAGEPLSSQYAQTYYKALYMACVHRFKSWGAAIEAAGLDYSKIRLRRKMTEEQIRDEIIQLYRSGEDLAYPNVRRKRQYLLAYGMKKLGGGSWARARQVCGITDNYRIPPHKRKKGA